MAPVKVSAKSGYWLARTPAEVTIGEVIRAVDGPLASMRGEAPEDLDYDGAAEHLRTPGRAASARAGVASSGGTTHASRFRH
jgi:DNA-binding IscR family transcriptional regulator